MENLIKISILGDHGVGKTTYLKTLLENNPTDKNEKQIEILNDNYQRGPLSIDFHPVKILQNDRIRNVVIFDKKYPMKPKGYRDSFFVNCQGLILMFDLSDDTTLTHLPKWFNRANQTISDAVPVLIVGNKSDLEVESKNYRDILNDQDWLSGRQYLYYKVSADLNSAVSASFQSLLSLIDDIQNL